MARLSAKFLCIFFCFFSTVALAYNPLPVQRSEGEIRLERSLQAAISDNERVEISKRMLSDFPGDIPMGRKAQNVLKHLTEDSLQLFKARLDANRTPATSYLYARALNTSKGYAEQGEWIMQNAPENYWGPYAAALASIEDSKEHGDEVVGLLEAAIELDPSRPVGYYVVATVYETLQRWEKAGAAYRAAMIVDPSDSSAADQLISLFALSRNAKAYFQAVEELLPDKPLSISIPLVGTDDVLDLSSLKSPVVLHFVESSCGACVGLSLPEINQLKKRGALPFEFYAIFTSAKNDKSIEFAGGHDINGNDWHIKFGWGSDELSGQLGADHDPTYSYYVLDQYAVPRALLVGHSTDTVATLDWLIGEIDKQR